MALSRLAATCPGNVLPILVSTGVPAHNRSVRSTGLARSHVPPPAIVPPAAVASRKIARDLTGVACVKAAGDKALRLLPGARSARVRRFDASRHQPNCPHPCATAGQRFGGSSRTHPKALMRRKSLQQPDRDLRAVVAEQNRHDVPRLQRDRPRKAVNYVRPMPDVIATG